MKILLVLLIASVTQSMNAFAIPLIKDAGPASAVVSPSQNGKLRFLKKRELRILKERMSVNYNFDGILGLSNCSGSLVRFNTSLPNQKALALSNGHCVDFNSPSGMIPANSYVTNQPASRSFKFLNPQGQTSAAAVAHATKIIYGTMTGTDISLYELDMTYEEIEKKFNAHALTISPEHPKVAVPIQILSGYWKRGYECSIEKFVYRIREDAYTWNDSIRYTPECETIHGTSGSPIINPETREQLGINNTGNDDGERCTMDNPCEVSEDGTIYVEKSRNYGQQVYQLYTCLNSASEFDLTVPGCKVFH